MDAALVWDGREIVTIPKNMDAPRADQMQGETFEKLGEVAGRTCYDSVGTGRDSAAYHKHIKDVINLSVYEHPTFTVTIPVTSWEQMMNLILPLLNRRGVWIECRPEELDVTVNLRIVLEWERHTGPTNLIGDGYNRCTIQGVLQHFGHQLAPMIVGPPDRLTKLGEEAFLKTKGLNENQQFITLWLYGSRGFSHEQVRHRFAISQRSTRYVDEDGSPYIEHPLITKYLNDETTSDYDRHFTKEAITQSIEADRHAYRCLVTSLQSYCTAKGLDKTTARKQARGAARGYLGNALATEMLFTASVANWHWILKNRKCAAADGEIRAIYTPGLLALQESQYGQSFRHYRLKKSPDGIGEVLDGG